MMVTDARSPSCSIFFQNCIEKIAESKLPKPTSKSCFKQTKRKKKAINVWLPLNFFSRTAGSVSLSKIVIIQLKHGKLTLKSYFISVKLTSLKLECESPPFALGGHHLKIWYFYLLYRSSIFNIFRLNQNQLWYHFKNKYVNRSKSLMSQNWNWDKSEPTKMNLISNWNAFSYFC